MFNGSALWLACELFLNSWNHWFHVVLGGILLEALGEVFSCEQTCTFKVAEGVSKGGFGCLLIAFEVLVERVLGSLDLVVLRRRLAEKILELIQIGVHIVVEIERRLEIVSKRRAVGTKRAFVTGISVAVEHRSRVSESVD